MTIHVRNKGHAGEREVARMLMESLSCGYLARNIDQVRDGGADIMTLLPYAIEVKRCQQLSFTAWRKQAVMQCTTKNPIPVLIYRQNRRPWKVQVLMKDAMKKKFVLDPEEWIEFSFEGFIGFLKGKGFTVEKT